MISFYNIPPIISVIPPYWGISWWNLWICFNYKWLAYLVGILVGALIIALLATLVVDFTEGDEGESEDIDVDEIEITFEDIK